MYICIEQMDLENETIGGISSFMENLIAYSPSMQFTVVGLTKDPQRKLGVLRTFEFAGKQVKFLPVGRFAKDGKKIFPVFLRIFLGLLRYRKSIPAGKRLLHHVETGFLSILTSHEKTVIFIHNSRESLTGKYSDSFWKYSPRLYNLVEEFVLRRANSIVVLAAVDYTRISKLNRKSYLSSTWYDSSLFNLENRKVSVGNEYRFVWAGRLESQKNPMVIIPIASALIASGVNFSIEVFGSGSLEFRMRREIRRLNLSEFVQLKGFSKKDQLARVFKSSDALFMTSHYEGSSIVLKEALGAGLPVIVNSESDPDGIVQENVNGFKVDLSILETYSQALNNSRKCLSINCSKSASIFTPDVVIPEILEIIEQ